MANSEDSTKSIFDRTGVVCDWFGKEIGVSYRLTSVPDGFTDDISDADQSTLEDGRFTGTMATVSTVPTLLLCPLKAFGKNLIQPARYVALEFNDHVGRIADEKVLSD